MPNPSPLFLFSIARELVSNHFFQLLFIIYFFILYKLYRFYVEFLYKLIFNIFVNKKKNYDNISRKQLTKPYVPLINILFISDFFHMDMCLFTWMFF
jgi:hypothetical protein